MELVGVVYDGMLGKDCFDYGVICGFKGDCVVIGLGLENMLKMVDGIWCVEGKKENRFFNWLVILIVEVGIEINSWVLRLYKLMM